MGPQATYISMEDCEGFGHKIFSYIIPPTFAFHTTLPFHFLFSSSFSFCFFCKNTIKTLKMRPAKTVLPLLILLLLLVETSKGIRFEQETLAIFHKIIYKDGFKGEEGASEVSYKENEPSSGRVRKLMTKAIPTSKSDRSNEKVNKSKRPEEFHVQPPETYPDVLDIVGMDYSPAKRKPPIHN